MASSQSKRAPYPQWLRNTLCLMLVGSVPGLVAANVLGALVPWQVYVVTWWAAGQTLKIANGLPVRESPGIVEHIVRLVESKRRQPPDEDIVGH